MTTVAVSVLALILTAQTQSREIDGSVVDEQGKPVAGATLILQRSVGRLTSEESADPRTVTDTAGRYRLAAPKARWIDTSTLWAYRPGFALATVPLWEEIPGTLVLKKPWPRTITIEGPDGKPIVGAKVSPESVVFVTGRRRRTPSLPDSVAQSLTATTVRDGKVTFDCVARPDQLFAVQVSTPSIGRQSLLVSDEPIQSLNWTAATIRLKSTSRIAGTVKTAAGEPCAGVPIEIYSQTKPWLTARPVEFESGPARTVADGSFQTPDNLLAGFSYRALVRAPGMEPALSAWITLGEKPYVLPPFLLRPLCNKTGRVVDRQGKPVAGIEVFQSGDGPERTSTLSDAAGRFTLGGFCQGAVFVFVRGEGWRFSGRLLKPGEDDVTLEITRLSEPPAQPMRMLPEPIPLVESRALARRLIVPEWKCFDARNDEHKFFALRELASIDPVAVLHKLDAVKPPRPLMKETILLVAVDALAQSDPSEAEAVAETINEPGARARALFLVENALPDKEHAHKLTLLERAIVQARNSAIPSLRANMFARVINRLCALGENARAQALLPEVLKLTKETGPLFQVAAMVARADLAAALQIAKDIARNNPELAASAYRAISTQVAALNPAEAERIWSLIVVKDLLDRALLDVTWKMAAVDPERAWRLTDAAEREVAYPERYSA